jgi:transcriptional regulator with XRE-family HTH domain
MAEKKVVKVKLKPKAPKKPKRSNATLGGRIEVARCAKGWSQEDVASAIGVRGRAISGIERGDCQSPRLTTLSQLAEVLGISIGFIVSGAK